MFPQRWRAWKRTRRASSNKQRRQSTRWTRTSSSDLMSLRQNSTTRWSPLKRRWKEVLLRYFLTANSFEQDRRWKNLKDLWWSWKPCWMGDYISITWQYIILPCEENTWKCFHPNTHRVKDDVLEDFSAFQSDMIVQFTEATTRQSITYISIEPCQIMK